MKKLLLLLMFVSSLSFGQIIIKQSNKVNFYETIWVATNGSTPNDTTGYIAKFLSNGDMYLKPNTPVVGYVLTAADTNGKATWQAAGGSGGYSPWDTTATAIVQKDTTLNVGIGTLTTTYKLEVQGTALLSDTFSFMGVNGASYQYADGVNGAGVGMYGTGALAFNGRIKATNQNLTLRYKENADSVGIELDDSGILFYTTAGETGRWVASTGNLGIGTNAPSQKLDVAASVKIDSTLILTGIYFTDTDSTFTIPSGLATALSWKAGGGAWVSGTVTLPANPVNGQIVSVSGDWTSVSLAASGGATIVYTPTATQFRHGASFIYRAANTTWFPQ